MYSPENKNTVYEPGTEKPQSPHEPIAFAEEGVHYDPQIGNYIVDQRNGRVIGLRPGSILFVGAEDDDRVATLPVAYIDESGEKLPWPDSPGALMPPIVEQRLQAIRHAQLRAREAAEDNAKRKPEHQLEGYVYPAKFVGAAAVRSVRRRRVQAPPVRARQRFAA